VGKLKKHCNLTTAQQPWVPSLRKRIARLDLTIAAVGK
jgi:hypothetical protein